MSSGLPPRRTASPIGVSIMAGHTAFTRILCDPKLSAADFVIPTTACLLAPYAKTVGVPESPATDAVFTIAPPPLFIIASATDFIPSHTPFTFTDITRSKSSSEYSNKLRHGPRIPALLKNASTRPNLSKA